jgi:hypothetical protein
MLLRRRDLLWPLRQDTHLPAGLDIHPRADWTEETPTEEPEPEDVRFLLVHHTAGSTEHRAADVPAILRGIHAYHVEAKGWNDIAYNFLIDRHGGVWEGRFGSLHGPVRGDATGGNQGFSQLVCLLGDFTAEVPTEEAQRSLVLTLAWLAQQYRIDVRPGAEVEFVSRGSNRWPEGTRVTTGPIAGHRDMSHTSCPGDAFYPLIAEAIVPGVREVTTLPSTTTTAESTTTEPPSTTVPSTTRATSPTTLPPATTAPSRPSTTLAAATDTESTGTPGLVGPVASALVGLTAGVLGWRIRRMSRSR